MQANEQSVHGCVVRSFNFSRRDHESRDSHARTCTLSPRRLCARHRHRADPAQQAQQEIRYVTVSKFAMPQDNTQRRLVMMATDSVTVPQARMDANVLSYRVLTHNWGANSSNILIMAECPNWAAIEAEWMACVQWVQSKTSAVGTPERARWDAMGAAFQRAYEGHSDEIYSAQMRRAKR